MKSLDFVYLLSYNYDYETQVKLHLRPTLLR